MALNWQPLSPFGALIDRDLARPFTPDDAEAFRDLFNARGLIVACGQSLTMEQQHAVSGLIGPILLREGENGYLSNETGGPSASELNWHSDAAYTDSPFDAISLHAVDVVDRASATRFVRTELAALDLPGDLLAALAGREQEMIAPHYTALAGFTCDQRDPASQKRGVLPTIRDNPHNGQACLWVSAMQTARILDMEWEESRALLHRAYACLYAPANVFEHRWQTGDFVIWDNIALQHMRANVEHCGRRVLQRAIVGTAGVAPHISAPLQASI